MFQAVRALLILIFCAFSVHSYDQVITDIKRYSTVDGLSDNRINSIIKDRDGFMWFGTWVGLSRFDGYQFSIYKSYPGDKSILGSSRITNIVEDGSGRYLWLKAYNNQIYRFDKHLQQFQALSDLVEDSALKKTLFTSILYSGNNSVWLKSENSGVFYVSLNPGSKARYFRFSANQPSAFKILSNEIKFFHRDQTGAIWLGTASGTNLLKLDSHNEYKVVPVKALAGKIFSKVTETKSSVWLATSTGLVAEVTHSHNKILLHKILAAKLNSMIASSTSSGLYCTTLTGELLRILPDGKSELIMKLNDASPLYSIFESRSGILWIESERFGIIRVDLPRKSIKYLFSSGKYKPWLDSDIFEDRHGVVWLNMKEKGLWFYNNERNTVESFSQKLDEFRKVPMEVPRVFYDPLGVMWLITEDRGVDKVVLQEQGFNQQLPRPDSKIRTENEIRALYKDKRNRLWVGKIRSGICL